MSRVQVNADELEQFANEINSFLETLNEATSRLSHSFEALGSTWQDQKRYQFEETFRELLQILKTFDNNAKEQIQHLRILVSKARDYLGT